MKYALQSPIVTTRVPTATRRATLFKSAGQPADQQKIEPRPPQRRAGEGQSTYKELTDSSSRMRRMVSASSAATDNCRILPHSLAAFDSGIESVTINSSNADFVSFSMAL